MPDLQISETVLVAFITGSLTLLAGIYGELFKNFFARRHRRLEKAAESRKEQLAAVRDFLLTAGALRISSLYEALPLTYTATSEEQVKKEIDSNRPNKSLAKCFRKPFSPKAKPPNHAYSTMYEFGMDTFKFKTANAKLRAELHKAWETMDLQLSDPQVRSASKKIQNTLRDSNAYVGVSITNPYMKERKAATFTATSFDKLLDELRETTVRQLTRD